MKLEEIEFLMNCAEALPFNDARHVMLGNLIYPTRQLLMLAKAVRNTTAPENRALSPWELLDHLQAMVEGLEREP